MNPKTGKKKRGIPFPRFCLPGGAEMGRNRRHSLPQVRLHSGSGHAWVRINGTEHWLGRFGSPEAQAACDRLLAEYLANGRQVAPKAKRQEIAPPIPYIA